MGRAAPIKEIIPVACIMDCPTITAHMGKCYKALIDSGATITLLRYSAYKKIEELSQDTQCNLLQPN